MSDHKKSMPYVRLGKSGLKVSKIILGCMSYGNPEWRDWLLSEEEGLKHIKAAYDMGIQTFDTAGMYSNGESEMILGKAIKQFSLPREEIVIMTKVCAAVGRTPTESYYGQNNPDDFGYVNQHGLSRKNIFYSVQSSLKRLQLDYVDLLQCHRFDPDTPIEETMQALDDVVKAGYVRYIGMGSCHAWQLHMMQNYAITNNLTPFISMQDHYGIVYREEEREMIPTLKHFGVGAIPYSTLARGWVTRPLDSEGTKRTEEIIKRGNVYYNEANKTIVQRIEEIAKKKSAKMAQIATAWILQKDGITAPIVGTTSIEKLEDLAAAVHIKLTDEEMKYLEEPYKPMPVLGHK